MEVGLMKEFFINWKPYSLGTQLSRNLNVLYLNVRYLNGGTQLSCSVCYSCVIEAFCHACTSIMAMHTSDIASCKLMHYINCVLLACLRFDIEQCMH